MLTLTRLAERGERAGGEALAQSYADALDACVRRWPAQYFWWHDRWRLLGDKRHRPMKRSWLRGWGRTVVCALVAAGLVASGSVMI